MKTNSRLESHIILGWREKTDGGISLQYLNGAEGESQPALVMFLDYTRRMDIRFYI